MAGRRPDGRRSRPGRTSPRSGSQARRGPPVAADGASGDRQSGQSGARAASQGVRRGRDAIRHIGRTQRASEAPRDAGAGRPRSGGAKSESAPGGPGLRPRAPQRRSAGRPGGRAPRAGGPDRRNRGSDERELRAAAADARARARQAAADAPATEPLRVQKLLAAAGIGSRREVERWIREGRLEIDGQVPALGTKLEPGARITLDGRPVRVRARESRSRLVLYYRSPGSPLDLKTAVRGEATAKAGRAAGRWLAIQPLPPVDGGLEILTDDGALAHRISRGVHALTMDYVLRMRGPLDDTLVEEFRAATACENEPMSLLGAEAHYGEGSNHWLNVTVRATRSALVRHWWAARGFIVSRLMRVRFGPVHLARDLPRGRSREMMAGERSALLHEIDEAAVTAPPSSEDA